MGKGTQEEEGLGGESSWEPGAGVTGKMRQDLHLLGMR